jgi:membrane protein
MEDKDLRHFFKTMQANISKHHIPAHASSAAFFVFLSVIPVLILLFSILRYTPLNQEALLSMIEGVFPASVQTFISGIIEEVYAHAGSYFSVAIVAVVWSAAKGILSIMTGLNIINDEKKNKNYLILRLWASIYTIILVLVLLLIIIAIMLGGFVFDLAMNELSDYIQIAELVSTLRFAVVWIVLVFTFVILYAKVPSVKMKLSYQIPGALFAATMWSLFSYIFSIYADSTNAFSMYGSLTTLIVVLLWLYFNMQFLFYGAEINHYLLPMKIREDEKREAIRKEKREYRKLARELEKKEKIESKKEKLELKKIKKDNKKVNA